jgi:hypothetical protein
VTVRLQAHWLCEGNRTCAIVYMWFDILIYLQVRASTYICIDTHDPYASDVSGESSCNQHILSNRIIIAMSFWFVCRAVDGVSSCRAREPAMSSRSNPPRLHNANVRLVYFGFLDVILISLREFGQHLRTLTPPLRSKSLYVCVQIVLPLLDSKR